MQQNNRKLYAMSIVDNPAIKLKHENSQYRLLYQECMLAFKAYKIRDSCMFSWTQQPERKYCSCVLEVCFSILISTDERTYKNSAVPSVYPVLKHLGEWKEETYLFLSHFLFVSMSNLEFLGNSFLFHSFFPPNNVIYFPAISGLNNSLL